MAKDKVFLDSSVLVTAVLSSTGGSFYILSELGNKFEFVTNEYVISEVNEVLSMKFSNPELKSQLFLLLTIARAKILRDPKKSKLKTLIKIINKKDAPILASAMENASCLITLDNDFLDSKITEFVKSKKFQILKPKDFIQKIKSVI